MSTQDRAARDHRVLIVTPVLEGSGEIVTALHVADSVRARGGHVAFLASPLARQMIRAHCDAPVWPLGAITDDNRASWERALAEFRPRTVLFADYPLLFFPQGCAPLAHAPGWVASLDSIDAELVTLDHFGFAQGERSLFLGPAHLGFFAQYSLPAVPRRMRVLLPCPMHDPGPVPGRHGEPFRYWDVPLSITPEQRAAVRERHGVAPGERLVVHAVSKWAMQGARTFELPLYRYLPRLLEAYLGELGVRVTLLSVNDGTLLSAPPLPTLRIASLASLPTREFEALLFAADLVLTENSLSIAMGKALCARIPCVALINSRRAIELINAPDRRISELVLSMERERTGAVYPWAVFPSVTPDDVDRIGLYRNNRITDAFERVELFGGAVSRARLTSLLTDENANDQLQARQQVYIAAVAALPEVADLL